MNKFRCSLMGLCIATASLGALAQSDADHKAHHPEGAASASSASKKQAAKPAGAEAMAKMDQQMKSMQAMHDKMMAAKTPEERQALMVEHRKMMQDGMSMMQQMGGMSGSQGMGGASMADRQKMMEKRMDMMQSMMQMMMDRMPPASDK